MMRSLLLLPIAALVIVLVACTPGAVQPETISYALDEQNNSGIDGIVTFEKMSATETRVSIDVDGTSGTQDYPAHIHVGDVGSGGAIYVTLGFVDPDTGTSSIVVTETDAGTAVDYEHLVNYDGYVNVHNPADPSVIFAAGEIGEGANDVQIDPTLNPAGDTTN
ncbi:MAG: CHRD domain-containing protein [Trueperaceae bacterium]